MDTGLKTRHFDIRHVNSLFRVLFFLSITWLFGTKYFWKSLLGIWIFKWKLASITLYSTTALWVLESCFYCEYILISWFFNISYHGNTSILHLWRESSVSLGIKIRKIKFELSEAKHIPKVFCFNPSCLASDYF